MSLAGLELAFFLPVVLLLYWAGPRRVLWQNAVLLLASYVVAASWNPRLVWVLLLATVVDFATGLVMGAHPIGALPADTPAARTARRWRKTALWTSIAFDVGLLVWFKYVGFFAESLNELLGVSLPVLKLALPIGLSYYTLAKLSYVLDLYYERIPVCRDPLAFGVFVAFFPQLVCGPIPRASALLPQYAGVRRLDPDLVRRGAGLFVLGFAMKAYIGDRLLGDYVDPVFRDPLAYAALSHWIALFGVAVQIFCDFAGYSFMAIGVGRLFGIELPENFRAPFLSRSMLEFWRRWHITLNQWLFDYLFAPLTTGRSWFRGRIAASFLVVFLLSGLWHGARWTYVVWGLLQGVALVVNHRFDLYYKGLCRKDRSYVALRKSRRYAIAAWVVTQTFFLFSLVPFQAATLGKAGDFLVGLVRSPGSDQVHVASLHLAIAFLFVIGFHLLALGPRGERLRSRFGALPAPVRGVLWGLALVFLLVFVPVGASTFVYAQF